VNAVLALIRPLRRLELPRLTTAGWIGFALLTAAMAVALLGPYVAPHEPDEIFGIAFEKPSSGHPLGLDFVGRDVLSRFLWGGRTAIFIALLGTTIGFFIGIAIGVYSAYRRGWVDEVTGRQTDLLLAFPTLVFALLLLAAFGTSLRLVVVAIAVTTIPGVIRIARAAALEVVDLPYVEAAKARGESTIFILGREILPNIRGPILVDFGLRLTASILLVAALSFLGLGLKPPAADWGLMIGENRVALTVQPWPVVVPVVAIACLTVGINLLLDGYRRKAGLAANEQTTAETTRVA
jgi:peptide/nickel transport system permease protein